MIYKSISKNSLCLLSLVIFVLLFTLVACNSNRHSSSDSFATSLGENIIDLNSGVTVQKSFPAEEDPEELVSLIILNHTDEEIDFKNSGFGLMLFCKDEKTNTWQKQTMPDEFVEGNRAIPPKTETLDADLVDINLTGVNKSTVAQVHCTQLRLFVQGIGQTTGRKYGAYTDLTIE